MSSNLEIESSNAPSLAEKDSKSIIESKESALIENKCEDNAVNCNKQLENNETAGQTQMSNVLINKNDSLSNANQTVPKADNNSNPRPLVEQIDIEISSNHAVSQSKDGQTGDNSQVDPDTETTESSDTNTITSSESAPTEESTASSTPLTSDSRSASQHVTTADTSLYTCSRPSTDTVKQADSNEKDYLIDSIRDRVELDKLFVDLPSIDIDMKPAVTDPEPSCSRPSPHTQSVYHIKWIKFADVLVPIITQNENGPCPLIAIMNVLLLKGKVKFAPMIEMVTSSQLMDYLGDCILENAPKSMTEAAMLNYEQNMHDAMAVFHKLQTGLDVNVKFTGISTFEYTSESIVFDLLELQLHHGWLVDPGNTSEILAVGQCSYNQLVEKIIAQKNSPHEEKVREALIAEDFLARTAHQLTYHGLCELGASLKDNQLSVFFRNNHFSTLLKHKDELFLLVTDQGFLTESNVIWETLGNVEGDGHFVDELFRTYRKAEPSTHVIPPCAVPEGSEQQIDQDYLVALSLQQEQQHYQEQQEQKQKQQKQMEDHAKEWPAARDSTLTDHELAVKLQEEENRRATANRQQQPPSGGANSSSGTSTSLPRQQGSGRSTHRDGKEGSKKSSGDCVLL